MKKELKLTDILVTIVIAIAFGIVYILWGTVYYAVQPLGLHLDQLLYGMWFIAGTVAYFIIRKPGVALLAEIAAASGEFLLGSPWGLTVLLSGVVQGLFAELVFMAFRYKRFDLKVAALAASASCVGSLLVDALNGQIAELALELGALPACPIRRLDFLCRCAGLLLGGSPGGYRRDESCPSAFD